MPTYQLRTYTLRSAEALQRYSAIHWPRHLATFPRFGVTTHGVWTVPDSDVPRLVALLSFRPGDDPDAVTRRVMSSPDFASDMAGFDVGDIVAVDTVLLEPAPLPLP